jgi:hypothetical protein
MFDDVSVKVACLGVEAMAISITSWKSLLISTGLTGRLYTEREVLNIKYKIVLATRGKKHLWLACCKK